NFSRSKGKPMPIPQFGSVHGIDAGYSDDRETTGLGMLWWDECTVNWSCRHCGSGEIARRCALRALCGHAARNCHAVAVDGPLRPKLTIDCTSCRSAEKLLMSGKFQRRGKPGPTNGGSG